MIFWLLFLQTIGMSRAACCSIFSRARNVRQVVDGRGDNAEMVVTFPGTMRRH